MHKIIIQGQNEKLYEVEYDDAKVEFVCKCSGYGNGRCFHTDKARDYVLNKFGRNKFSVTSAFHKEVRRSDHQRGMTWALIMQKTQGKTRLRDYCRGICFEETRNVALFDLLHNRWEDVPREEIARAMVLSKKRWMDTEHDCFQHEVDGYIAQAGKLRLSIEDIQKTVSNSDNIVQWFAAAFSVSRYEKGDEKDQARASFRQAVIDRVNTGKKVAFPDEVRLIAKATKCTLHERLALCEIATGHWDKSMNEFDKPKDEYRKPNYIPKFEDYVFDNHTSYGKKRLEDCWFEIEPGRAQPEKVDMRWSGMMYGLQWRFDACRQHGSDISHVNWKAVDVRPDLWLKMKRLDGWFYKSFYGRVHVLHWRLDDDPVFPTIVDDNDWHLALVRPDEYERQKRNKYQGRKYEKVSKEEVNDEVEIDDPEQESVCQSD